MKLKESLSLFELEVGLVHLGDGFGDLAVLKQHELDLLPLLRLQVLHLRNLLVLTSDLDIVDGDAGHSLDGRDHPHPVLVVLRVLAPLGALDQ